MASVDKNGTTHGGTKDAETVTCRQCCVCYLSVLHLCAALKIQVYCIPERSEHFCEAMFPAKVCVTPRVADLHTARVAHSLYYLAALACGFRNSTEKCSQFLRRTSAKFCAAQRPA
jgi:hypothetical protein